MQRRQHNMLLALSVGLAALAATALFARRGEPAPMDMPTLHRDDVAMTPVERGGGTVADGTARGAVRRTAATSNHGGWSTARPCTEPEIVDLIALIWWPDAELDFLRHPAFNPRDSFLSQQQRDAFSAMVAALRQAHHRKRLQFVARSFPALGLAAGAEAHHALDTESITAFGEPALQGELMLPISQRAAHWRAATRMLLDQVASWFAAHGCLDPTELQTLRQRCAREVEQAMLLATSRANASG